MRTYLNSRAATYVVFILALCYYAFDLRMHELLFEPPSRIHLWRQADGASLTSIFYQDGNSLFKPKIHNQLGKDGSAGGEFPIMYYLTSKLYHLFGPQEYLLRLVHFASFLAGLLVFLHYSFTFFQIRVFALIPVLLAISSPTLMFYALNFLPDAPAFGLSLCASSLLFLYLLDGKEWKYLAAVVLFVFSGLIKISMLLPMFAIVLAVALRHFTGLKKQNRPVLIRCLLLPVWVLLPVAVWYLYISHYNEIHDGDYFTTKVTPLWDLSLLQLAKSTLALFDYWPSIVFPKWTGYAMVGFSCLFLLLWKRIDPVLRWSTVFCALGAFAYTLLFYIAFADHDYYFIVYFLPVIFLFTSVVQALHRVSKSRWRNVALLALLGVLCWKTLGAAVYKNKQTYRGWFRDFSYTESLYTLEPFLEEHGITYEEKVYVAPDMSPNIALYLMNRKGWTQLNGVYTNEDLDKLIRRGARYAVVLDTSFYGLNYIRWMMEDTVGLHGDILVVELERPGN